MLGKREEESSDAMVDVTFSQSEDERSVVAVLQKLYLCASVDFLMAVAEFFLQALPQAPAAASDKLSQQIPLKQSSEPKNQGETRGTCSLTSCC